MRAFGKVGWYHSNVELLFSVAYWLSGRGDVTKGICRLTLVCFLYLHFLKSFAMPTDTPVLIWLRRSRRFLFFSDTSLLYNITPRFVDSLELIGKGEHGIDLMPLWCFCSANLCKNCSRSPNPLSMPSVLENCGLLFRKSLWKRLITSQRQNHGRRTKSSSPGTKPQQKFDIWGEKWDVFRLCDINLTFPYFPLIASTLPLHVPSLQRFFRLICWWRRVPFLTFIRRKFILSVQSERWNLKARSNIINFIGAMKKILLKELSCVDFCW